jgi:hypothetical protein
MVSAQRQAQWKRFFDGYGFVHCPGLVADRIDRIETAYEETFVRAGIEHDGTQRSSCPAPFERHEELARLLDAPALRDLLEALLGEDYVYLSSGADLYVGGGMWHPDGSYPPGWVKVAFYLDPLTKANGALRLVPGSHLFGYVGNLDTQALWGLSDEEVPCVAPDNQPGDVLAFHPNTLHNSLGGGRRRRMLNFMACRRPQTDEEWQFFDARMRTEPLDFADQVRATASEERQAHLRLAVERERLLAGT